MSICNRMYVGPNTRVVCKKSHLVEMRVVISTTRIITTSGYKWLNMATSGCKISQLATSGYSCIQVINTGSKSVAHERYIS